LKSFGNVPSLDKSLQEFSQILAISEKILSSVSRGEFFRGLRTSLNRDVKLNKKIG